jgi:hypothetical protein
LNKTIFIIAGIVILFLIGIVSLEQNTSKNNLSSHTAIDATSTNPNSSQNTPTGFNFTAQQIPAFNFPAIAYADKLQGQTAVYNAAGQKMDANVSVAQNGNGSAVTFSPSSSFVPGKYTLVVDDNGKQFKQDFTWGVLAINTNKSIYLPNETANLALAVLDQKGNMVCNASVTLLITAPNGTITTLSTNNGTIIVNPECQMKKVTNKPDYVANYQVQGSGIYKMNLTATSANGTYAIADEFTVQNSVPFAVERITATRIFPYNPYPVSLKITANQDFTGKITEEVPSSFQITPLVDTLTYDTIENATANKIITWNVALKTGQVINLGYNYTPPNISPQFYLLGPLTFSANGETIFTESRHWQIASDAGIAFVQECGNATSSPTTVTCSTAAGDLLVVLISAETASSQTINTVQDNNLNNFTRTCTAFTGGTNSKGELWYRYNATAATSVTITASSGIKLAAVVEEFSGVKTSADPSDVFSCNSAASGTTLDSNATATTTQSNEVAVGFLAGHTGTAITMTASGFTPGTQQTNAASATILGGYHILSTTQTQDMTGTVATQGWAAGVATFIAAPTTSPSFQFQGLRLSGVKLN